MGTMAEVTEILESPYGDHRKVSHLPDEPWRVDARFSSGDECPAAETFSCINEIEWRIFQGCLHSCRDCQTFHKGIGISANSDVV
jgi:hypothetical protein